jgi:hypothetical protein
VPGRGPTRSLTARVLAALVLPALAGACATAPNPGPPAAPAPTPAAAEAISALASTKPVRMAWLPVDTLMHPKLGAALNNRLEAATLPGITSRNKGAVSMETAQLSLECSQPTPECHAAVGRHLGANRLLWAELKPGSRKKAVTVALFLFDVDGSAMVAQAERMFPTQQAALAGLDALVAQLTPPATPANSPTSQASTTAP